MPPTLPANPDILDRIPLSAQAVLDVGCGTGATLAAYRGRNPRCRLFGIDRDPDACAAARAVLDAVAEMDAEDQLAPFGAQRFDCIVYDGSLERMRDPWRVLAGHAALLAPGGVVLICVPNIEHWSFAHALIAGAFGYHESGLFDRAHLRWFGLESMQAALIEAGLHPLDVIGRVFDADAASGFADALGPALAALGVDGESYRRRAAPLQYVWRATAAAQDRLLLLSTMLAPVGGVSEVRVAQPMLALGREPGIDARILTNLELPDAADETPRILIFHRPCLVGEQGLSILRQVRRLGYLTVCEFDDHPDFLPVLQRDDVLNFTGVHAVQTTTPELAAVLGQRNPNIAVFPNAVDRLEPPRNFADPGRMTLFFGGINRGGEWPALMPTLNDVLREVGERLAVEVVNDEAFFAALDTPHKRFTPLCDYATYRAILAGCEISLMPLRDILFNRCKSDLKFLEAAAARVTPLASPVVYGASIRHGETGMIFASPDDMASHLRHLIANPEAAMRIADRARDYVASHRMLAYQMHRRESWYRDLWARRDALARALHARLPQLDEN
jgi:SAM-dependent methyltransferase